MPFRLKLGGWPEAPAVAGIEIRARKTELASKPGGISAGIGPLDANGGVEEGPASAERMLSFRLWAIAEVIAPLGTAPAGSQGSLGTCGFASLRNTSCMAKESS